MTGIFTDGDRQQLNRHGIDLREAGRQVEALREPPRFARLERPCTVGDGIVGLSPEEGARLAGFHDRAARAERILRFVPASGAATRMFKHLIACRADPVLRRRRGAEDAARSGSAEAATLHEFVAGIHRFAFREDLDQALHAQRSSISGAIESGRFGVLLDGLLDPHGLGYAALPKGLLKFHAYPEGSRTSFEEHLIEAAALQGAGESARLHFTVSPEHIDRYRGLLEEIRGRREETGGIRFQVDFSTQKSSTDTLALDAKGLPFRLDDGSLLLRPSGHGALLENLGDLKADLVFIKNIDNIAPDHRRDPSIRLARTLIGLLVEVQEECFQALRHLEKDEEGAPGRAAAILERRFGLSRQGASREEMIRSLRRPLRICGMVRNEGDPGGGPFMVRDAAGDLRPQIVESAQVDPGSGEQAEILGRSSHFNPVLIACGLRDHRDHPYDLNRFVDPEARMVTDKSAQGRPLRAMERPGLWNGAMAGWNTIFVEAPREAFTPVKTVNDLLQPEHQPA